MGSDRSGQFLRGLLTPDPRRTFWAAESGEFDAGGVRLSSLQSASPVAGIPVPVRSTQLALRARGAQTEAIRVRTVRAGLPGIDEAGVLWRPGSATDLDLRGHDLASICTRWEPLFVAGGPYRSPHVVTLSDGTLVATWWLSGAGVQVSTRDPVTRLWSAAVTVQTGLAANLWPCLLVLPDDRVHLYCWESGTSGQVVVHYSVDRGTTWTRVGPCLSTALSTATYPDRRRLRAAYSTGQVALLAHVVAPDSGLGTGLYRDRIAQWASSDGGHVLELVAVQDGGGTGVHSGISPDIVAMPTGGFLVARVRWSAASGVAVAVATRLGSAAEALDTVGDTSTTLALTPGQLWGVRAGGGGAPAADYYYTDSDLALVLDEDGAVYLLGRICTGADAGACPVIRSTDEGTSWELTGASSRFGRGQSWSDLQTANAYPTEWAATVQRGRVVVVTGWYRLGALTGFLGVAYLGGWSTLPAPSDTGVLSATARVAWDRTGLSIALPEESVWTAAGPGAGVLSAVGGLTVTCGAGQTRSYSYVPTASVVAGAAHEWALAPGMGTASHTIRLSDATPQRFEAAVIVSPTYARLYDIVSGNLLGEVAPLPAVGRVRVRLEVAGGAAKAWVCADTTDEDRDWEVIGSGALVAAADNPGNRVEWGCPENSVATWWEWPGTYGTYLGAGWSSMGPADKMPRSVVPDGVWLGRAVIVSATTGPTLHGDEWDIDPDDEYPVAALDPRQHPSPRTPWRSRLISAMDPATTQIRIAWRLDTADAAVMSPLWGAWFDRVNCAGIELWLRYGGAWHQVGTTGVDTVTMHRHGSTFVPGAAPGGSMTWRRGELVGGAIEVLDGGGQAIWAGEVAENSPGSTRTATQTLRTALRTSTSVAGLGGAGLPCRLWPRRHLLLWLAQDFSTAIEGVAIRMPVRPGAGPWTPPGPPPAGYHELGLVVFGPIWAWGWDYSWGRRLDHEPGTELITAEDGSRSARELGPVRRIIELGWADPVPSHDVNTAAEPDYVTGIAGGEPVAWFRDTPIEVADELVALAGALTPSVYLPAIPRPPVGGYARWGQDAVYVRITEAVSLDAVRGQEGLDESKRLQALVLEEEQ